MRNIFILMVLLTTVGGGSDVLAQGDSAWLNAGYLNLKRDLTQTVVIKGSDLEKMPFANLSDAIAAWLYGAYTQPATLQYFVDGSPVTDVNAYSVFDVEEVVLVENAAAMVNTAETQQEVVLIRTRRGNGKTGLTAAAQTGLVNGGAKGVSTDTRWYHQYYLGANANPGSWRFGASASWLRDILPTSEAYQIVTPDNLQRWRLHGYVDWQPDRHDQLELAVGYVPEQVRAATDSTAQYYKWALTNTATQRFFLPELRWRGQWLRGLTNELQATYVQSVYQGGELSMTTPADTAAIYSSDSIGGVRSSYHVYVRDRLSYRLASGGWRFEPAMNFSYEHVRERTIYEQYSQDSYGPNGTPYYSIDEGYGEYWYHLLCYTPQLDIQYKNGFDLKGGEMIQAGLQEPSGAHKAFFFVSGSLDLLRMVDEKRDSGLVVFGSYSQRAASPAIGYQLADLTYGYTNEGLFGNSTGTTGINGNGFIYNEYPPASQRWWVWEAGLRYTGLKGRLQVQGTVERRNYTPQAVVYEPVGSGFSLGSIYPVTTALLLHLDVRATILRGAAGDWEMGINGTVLRSKVDGFTSVNADGSLIGYAGDVYPNPYSVTGGWVNRVRVRHFIGGLDLLYHFGETYYETGVGVFPAVTRKLNSVAVPNIYAGYRFGPAHSEVEVFVESRGAIRDSPNDVTDGRRYYTLGGKLSI